jgi:hypothetical protein
VNIGAENGTQFGIPMTSVLAQANERQVPYQEALRQLRTEYAQATTISD